MKSDILENVLLSRIGFLKKEVSVSFYRKTFKKSKMNITQLRKTNSYNLHINNYFLPSTSFTIPSLFLAPKLKRKQGVVKQACNLN